MKQVKLLCMKELINMSKAPFVTLINSFIIIILVCAQYYNVYILLYAKEKTSKCFSTVRVCDIIITQRGDSLRLFIAILFDEKIKTSLYDAVLRLKSGSLGGSFTDRENLHLTVNFIGETKRLEEVKAAMQRAVEKSDTGRFSLSICGFGKFDRREGDIYWIGVEREAMLWRVQKELVKELKEEGFFDIDDREYKPHLTLGRRVKVDKTFDRKQFEASLLPMEMEVSRLSLMKSERIDGKLTYTEIYHISLS